LIVSKLKVNKPLKKGGPIQYVGKVKSIQKVTIKCDECGKIYRTMYWNVLDRRPFYGKDLCRGCKSKVQYSMGLRKSPGWKFLRDRGSSFDEYYGKEKSKEIRNRMGKKRTGKNNPMFGKNYQTHGAVLRTALFLKGKKYNDIYGEKKAGEIKEKLSKASKGKSNPMYGKPSPAGSGNGWKGWYKGKFFRSLLELSFMVNFLNRKNIRYSSAEVAKYGIPYKSYTGSDRTYFADFVIGKELVEIKPSALLNTPLIALKTKAAKAWCADNGFLYKIYTELDFDPISPKDLKFLVDSGEIVIQKRYKEKIAIYIKMAGV